MDSRAWLLSKLSKRPSVTKNKTRWGRGQPFYSFTASHVSKFLTSLVLGRDNTTVDLDWALGVVLGSMFIDACFKFPMEYLSPDPNAVLHSYLV